MNYTLLLPAVFLTLFVQAQDCSKEILKQKPGTWKAGPQGSIQNVTPADLAREKKVLAGIYKIINTGYKPNGCEISYSMVYGKSLAAGQNWKADPYYFSMYLLRFLCDENSSDRSKYYVDHSTPTTVTIAANVIYSLNSLYAADLEADNSRGFLKLKKRPEIKNGIYFMGEEVVGDSHLPNKIIEYRWLITFDDTLPFSYISRKDFLSIQKIKLEQAIKDNPGEKKFTEKYLQNITVYLTKPESELNQPAICGWNDEERFEKFAEEGTPSSFFAVRPNPAYYRKNLPKSTPQFFTVVVKIAHGDPVFEENISAIKKAVDFAALKNMLGK